MYNGQYFSLTDFSGGYAGNLPSTQIALNQASSLDNIILMSGGKGFRSRLGNTKLGIAVLTIQDLTYTAVASYTAGESVSIAYTAGATAGSEVVTVVGNAITIQIESGVSTAAQVKTKYDLSAAAVALATCAVTGTAGTAQTAPVVAANLAIPTINSGAPIQGIGELLTASGVSDGIVVAGNKIYNTDAFDGAMHDITGSATITSGADNQWDIFTFNDSAICFGGPASNPNTPLKWAGTGNVATLGASAPLAYGAFSANNRVFAFRTAANPSTMYWSIIGDPTDWSGAGSGSAVIGSLSDAQRITGAIVLSTNYVLVFKENSTHQMVISSAPFPVYSLFDNVGCVGKNAMVNVDGTVYFITSKGEMKATNGEEVISFPDSADDLWGAVQNSRLPYVCGFRHQGTDFDHIVWCVSTTGTTNNTSIVWDITNKCWLRNTTGFKMNVVGHDSFNNVYMGGYNGNIYIPEVTGRYADASETAPGTISSYWQSGWISEGQIDKIVQVRKMTVVASPKASGTISVSYGFDGVVNSTTSTLSQVASSTENYVQKNLMISGRGNTFEYKIAQSSSTIDMKIQSILLQGKIYGQKGQAQD